MALLHCRAPAAGLLLPRSALPLPRWPLMRCAGVRARAAPAVMLAAVVVAFQLVAAGAWQGQASQLPSPACQAALLPLLRGPCAASASQRSPPRCPAPSVLGSCSAASAPPVATTPTSMPSAASCPPPNVPCLGAPACPVASRATRLVPASPITELGVTASPTFASLLCGGGRVCGRARRHGPCRHLSARIQCQHPALHSLPWREVRPFWTQLSPSRPTLASCPAPPRVCSTSSG
jgi:hypothetical protein